MLTRRTRASVYMDMYVFYICVEKATFVPENLVLSRPQYMSNREWSEVKMAIRWVHLAQHLVLVLVRLISLCKTTGMKAKAASWYAYNISTCFSTLIVQLSQPDILDAGCFISHHPVKWNQIEVMIKPVANKKDIAVSPSVQRLWSVSWDETPPRCKNMNALLLLNRASIPSGVGPPVCKVMLCHPKNLSGVVGGSFTSKTIKEKAWIS